MLLVQGPTLQPLLQGKQSARPRTSQESVVQSVMGGEGRQRGGACTQGHGKAVNVLSSARVLVCLRNTTLLALWPGWGSRLEGNWLLPAQKETFGPKRRAGIAGRPGFPLGRSSAGTTPRATFDPGQPAPSCPATLPLGSRSNQRPLLGQPCHPQQNRN